jgi:hypothetical protein
VTAAPEVVPPRERPILFSAPMVRAVLEGRKTQTRRIVQPQPIVTAPYGRWGWHCDTPNMWDYDVPDGSTWRSGTSNGMFRCPYADGDVDQHKSLRPQRLWVKETFGRTTGNGIRIVYRADGEEPKEMLTDRTVKNMKWSPSIFMPRELSRITLEVTAVRVERLQSISEEDARAEGVPSFFERFTCIGRDQCLTSGELCAESPYRASFAVLWDELNGDRAVWKSNAFVWVIGFRLVKP